MLELILKNNPILTADGYKINHYLEMPEGLGYTYVVVVPRSGSKYSKLIVAMGQTMVAEWFQSVRITHDMINEAEAEVTSQGYQFNRRGWEIIVDEFDGRLPLKIFAVEEGMVVQPQTPIMGLINTDPRFKWLPAYYETFVQCVVWKMSTVASICKTMRTTISRYIEQTGSKCSVDYMMHFFGDRSADGPEAAIMSGIAHAALFDGSDCVQANRYIKRLYNTRKSYLSSVEATEHGSMLANSDSSIKDDFGAAVMLVERLKKIVASGNPVPKISGVIDTYNSRRFVQEYLGTRLHDDIVNSGGTLICRPDSGNPAIEPGLVGNDIISKFGFTYNSHGLKVLPPFIGVIQGDGIDVYTFESVLKGWIDAGFSLDNFCLGCGKGISHDGGRDDFSFSVKSVANFANGQWNDMLKDPITDSGKKSLTGLVQVDDDMSVIVQSTEIVENSKWKLWFENGQRTYFQSFDSVRENARN
jgi:nicotinamide phosphoribosyltransferase